MSPARNPRAAITVADRQLAALAKSLAHPARVAILRQLAERTVDHHAPRADRHGDARGNFDG